MSQIKIYKDEVPINRPCHVWIEEKFNLIEKMNRLTPKYTGKDLIRCKIDIDVDKLSTGIQEATDKYKWWGWINRNKNSNRSEETKIKRTNEGTDFLRRGSYYGGWSIKYIPKYCEEMGLAPEGAGLGELPSPISWFIYSNLGNVVFRDLEESQQLLSLTRLAIEQGYAAVIKRLIDYKIITEEQSRLIKIPNDEKLSEYHKEKNGYYDTWSFTDWTNAAVESGVRDLTNSANCQVLRSRVAWQRGEFRNYRLINPNDYENSNDRWTWHTDEPVVHNLRVVIPIQTSNAYAMEIKPHAPRILEKGYAYTWDTNIVHRQIQIDNTSKLDRIFVILGFNPWFNWIPEEQAWVSNEFYGKMHPLDMMCGGHVLPSVKFDKVIHE